MAIALLATPEINLDPIASALQREGLAVVAAPLDGRGVPATIEGAILICSARGVVSIGEPVTLVRHWLASSLPLVLCASLLVADDRARLRECGATDIVTPEDWSASAIATRVLGQLIVGDFLCPQDCGAMRGGTRQMRDLYAQIRTLAPLTEPVIILGETGTGKELVAQQLHHQSQRGGKFVAINCPEISPELLPSELFGHERGAFTNATHTRQGLLVEAGRGTVFLDEIGELDLPSQAKLLRVLEEGKVRRVGANKWEDVKARLVLATNRNLVEEVREKRFRADLWERMQGLTIHLPPLRQRKADLPLLAQHFVAAFAQKYERSLTIPDGALDCLFRYHWPGNVRELRGVLWRAATYADANNQISALMLQEEVRKRTATEARANAQASSIMLPSSSDSEAQTLTFDATQEGWQTVRRRVQKAYFEAVLRAAHGNKDAASKLAGLSRTQFYDILKRLDDEEKEEHGTDN